MNEIKTILKSSEFRSLESISEMVTTKCGIDCFQCKALARSVEKSYQFIKEKLEKIGN